MCRDVKKFVKREKDVQKRLNIFLEMKISKSL